MPAPRIRPSLGPCSWRCQWLLCSLLILAGFALSTQLGRRVLEDARSLRRQQFEHLAAERFSRLQERLQERQRDLDSVRRFVENSDTLDPADFERFTQPLLDGNRAISWAPLLQVDPQQRDEQLRAFSDHAVTLVGSRFQLREVGANGELQPLQPRERYFPLLFSVSRNISRLPLGLDMASSAPRQAALADALHSDQVSSSAVLHFASGDATDRLGLLFVVPVHDHPRGRHAAPDQDAPLRGALFSSISLRQLLAGSFGDTPQDSLAVVLSAGEGTHAALYRLNQPAGDDDLRLEREFSAGGQRYRLLFRPTATFIVQHPLPPLCGLVLPGAALSLLLGTLLFLLLSQHRRAVGLVERRTAELQRSREALRLSEERWALALDGIGDGVWDWDLGSDRLYFSPAWKALLGFADDEIGDTPEEWRSRLHPDDLAASKAALTEHLAGRTPMYRSEERLRRKDGTWLWLLARGRVVERAPGGRPVRAIGTHVDISVRKTLELELRQSNARLQNLLESATQVAIIAVNADGSVRTFNSGAERLLGYRREDLCGRPLDALLPPAPGTAVQRLATLLGGQRQHGELETVLLRRNREPLHVTLMLSKIQAGEGETDGYLLIAVDIGERLRSRQALEERSRLLEKLGAQVPGTIYQYRLFADGRSCFPYASAGIREVYAVEPEQVRSDAATVFERIHPEDRERIAHSIRQSAGELSRWQADYRVLLPQRGLRWLRGDAMPERLADGSVLWHGFLTDITNLKQVEDELRTLTVTDPLTGIYNRRYFLDQLRGELARHARSGHGLGLIMLDIDHFKRVNDSFGHDVGDLVLKELCRRLATRLRRTDTFCRLGGEEFVVICPEADREQTLHLAEDLRRRVEDSPFPQAGPVTISLGVSSAQADDDGESLLQRADHALYAAKESGRNRVCAEAEALGA